MPNPGRKDDHVRLAVGQWNDGGVDMHPFDEVRLVHHALAGTAVQKVSLQADIDGMRWPTPLFVNAMTGGTASTGVINRGLAIAAREAGVPIASGSMSAYFADPSVGRTYRVLREENPDGIVIANVNPNATPDMARRAVDLIGADALQVHVNAVQEIVMPEGDRDFTAWPGQIAALVEAVDVPVVVKEVGFGMSSASIRTLADLGVRIVDVSGRGGTDFAAIENARRSRADYGFMTGWGQSTAECLATSAELATHRGVSLLGSGGVRHPLDVVRALALGARAVGVSGYFLSVLQRAGIEVLTSTLSNWLAQIRQLMAILGATTVADLWRTDIVLVGRVADFCRSCGIDPATYAGRGERRS